MIKNKTTIKVNWVTITFISIENHKLLFLESSALESTNVEAAFNNVLMGESLILYLITFTDLNCIYIFTLFKNSIKNIILTIIMKVDILC